MKGKLTIFAASLLATALSTTLAHAENNPVDEKWWPSEFGADDEAGGTNYITAQKRIEAAKLVKKGKMALLGHPYSNHMPLVPGRTFALSIPSGGTTTHGPLNWPGDGFDQTFYDELVTAEIGQVGTQWDGLAHPTIRVKGQPGWKDGDYFYNRNLSQEVGTARGFKKLGPEKAGGFFTRGLLIDVAALKGVKTLPKGYAITLADYKAALAKQGVPMRRRVTWWCSARAGMPCGRPITSAARPARRRNRTSRWPRTTRSSDPASPVFPRRSATTWHRRRSR